MKKYPLIGAIIALSATAASAQGYTYPTGGLVPQPYGRGYTYYPPRTYPNATVNGFGNRAPRTNRYSLGNSGGWGYR